MLNRLVSKSIVSSFLKNCQFRAIKVRFVGSDIRPPMPASGGNPNISNMSSSPIKSIINKSSKMIPKPLKKYQRKLLPSLSSTKKKPASRRRKSSLFKSNTSTSTSLSSSSSKGKRIKRRQQGKKGKRPLALTRRGKKITLGRGRRSVSRARRSFNASRRRRSSSSRRNSSKRSSSPKQDTFYVFEMNDKKK